MEPAQLEALLKADPLRKISRRDFGPAIARSESGGTTVAGTLVAAHAVGIRVFATGGIGGVHRDAPFDVSADLPELSQRPVVVVCAGAKAILDLPATLEYLETAGVPVVGYQTDSFPAFYSRDSGLPLTMRAETPGEVARIAQAHWDLGLHSAVPGGGTASHSGRLTVGNGEHRHRPGPGRSGRPGHPRPGCNPFLIEPGE